ncbi:MAG TPA: DNA primase [Solirubrobacteraceae bacterium]|nr:DNA primase [Solirubrobacteraceae bacterium]
MAGRYTEDSIERVREAIDMVDLVGSKTELRRAGVARLEGLCPFHDERTPSFGIDPVKKLYHCFGCGAGGDAINFVRETEGVDFVGAIELLADRYGVELQVAEEDPQEARRRAERQRLFSLLDRTASYYERVLWEAPEAASARAYLESRGLSRESLEKFRVGYSPSAWDRVMMASRRAGFSEAELLDTGLVTRNREGRIYDRFRGRIMFPLWDSRGRVIGFGARAMGEERGAKYINTPESRLFHKGNEVYGAHLARSAAAKKRETIVVEGYTDVIALHQAGFENVVASMGTALTDAQVKRLAMLAPLARLAMDADSAGQEAMRRAARVAGDELALVVVALPKARDPADIALSSPDEVGGLLERAVDVQRFLAGRILETADLSSARGKDAALRELGPLYAEISNPVLAAEVLDLASTRVDLSVDQTRELLVRYRKADAGPRRSGPAQPEPVPEGARRVSRPLSAVEEIERTFLSQCLALPGQGREALARIDFEEHLTSSLHRRLAAHIRDHPDAPLDTVPEDDDELRSAVSELEARRSRDMASPATLDAQRLQLELRRLTRRLNAARQAGEPIVTELAAQREQVQAQLDTAIERAMSTS